MPDGVSISVDLRAFDQTLRKYVSVSKRTIGEIVVNKSLDLAFESLKATKFADPAKISRELSQSVTTTVSTDVKGRRRVRRRLHFGIGDTGTLAARIINSRRKALGQPPLWGRNLTEAAKKLTAARLRSVHFAQSGWLPAIKKLSALAGRGARFAPGVKQFGPPQGDAIASLGGSSASVTIVNTACNTLARPGEKDPHNVGLQRVVEEGLQKGVAAVTADMQRHIEQKLQAEFDRL